MSDPTDEAVTLHVALTVAGKLIDLVDKEAPASAQSRDRNDQLLWLALARGFRCLRSIRDLVVGHQEADDAFALTRALLSTALRSLWVAVPSDPDERIRRGRIFTRYSLLEAKKQAQELESLGMTPDIEASVLEDKINGRHAAGLEYRGKPRALVVQIDLRRCLPRSIGKPSLLAVCCVARL